MTGDSVKEIALRKALAMLAGAGAKYKIVLPDGTEYGDLVLAKPEPEKQRKKRVVTHNFVKLYDYCATLRAMQPGDCHAWDKLPYEHVQPFRGAVSGMAAKIFGPKNFITTCNPAKGIVEVMCTDRVPQ